MKFFFQKTHLYFLSVIFIVNLFFIFIYYLSLLARKILKFLNSIKTHYIIKLLNSFLHTNNFKSIHLNQSCISMRIIAEKNCLKNTKMHMKKFSFKLYVFKLYMNIYFLRQKYFNCILGPFYVTFQFP